MFVSSGIRPGVAYLVNSNECHQELITRSLQLPYKPLETTFARIFLFLDLRIPTNALCRPIRTKLLYYVTSSHAPVIAFLSQNILKIKRYGQRLTQGYSLDGGSRWWAPDVTHCGSNECVRRRVRTLERCLRGLNVCHLPMILRPRSDRNCTLPVTPSHNKSADRSV